MPINKAKKYFYHMKRKFRNYDKITGMSKIARRYFVMNAFDGALIMFGLITGSFLAQIRNPFLIFSVGMSTVMAIGVSGLWGAFLTEGAERRSELRTLEKSMLRKLSSSDIGEASRAAIYITTVVNAASPFLAGLIVLLPFLLSGWGLFNIDLAYRIAFGLSFAIFFGLGAFLGRLSKDLWWIAGIKMLLAGLMAAILTFLLSSAGFVTSV